MKYKVGDKVRVKSLDWYNTNKKGSNGEVYCMKGPIMVSTMSKLCGQVVTISEVGICDYCIKEDENHFFWAEEIFEELINNKDMKKSDLKPGMVIETKNKKRYLCTEVNGSIVGLGIDYFMSLESQNDDLSYCDEEFSIVKVYKIKSRWSLSSILENDRGLELIWELPKITELTMNEIAEKFGIPVSQLKIKK